MSEKSHNHQKGEHGTTRSYIIGFILSLVYTAIPYFLVVNKVVSGTALLATILGFAVFQMLVQLLFFLHLGRGPKPLYNVAFFASTVGIILVVVGGSIVIIHNLHYNMSPSDQINKIVNDENIYQVGGQKTGACQNILVNHKIIIDAGKLSSPHIDAKLCDTLTFIVSDNIAREIVFGPSPNHDVYAGQAELSVSKGRNETITLSQSGTYQFRDNTDPSLSGDFTVAP
jgi:cytochrome o ubiquinol oxidase subunit IV